MSPITRSFSPGSAVSGISLRVRAVRRTIYFLLVVAWFCLPAQAQTRRVVAIAHRGEHLRNPENTIPAFEEAIRVGADFIEVDVRTTADGKLVLSHDGTVDRRTTSKGEISKMTFDEVRALDAGVKSGPEFAGT